MNKKGIIKLNGKIPFLNFRFWSKRKFTGKEGGMLAVKLTPFFNNILFSYSLLNTRPLKSYIHLAFASVVKIL